MKSVFWYCEMRLRRMWLDIPIMYRPLSSLPRQVGTVVQNMTLSLTVLFISLPSSM